MKISNLILTLLFLSASITVHAQWWGGGKSVSGEGPRVTKTIDLDDFTGIGLSLGADVHLEQGSKQKVTIKAQQNIIDLIQKEVRGGEWKIGFEKGINLRRHDGIDIYITIPTVDKLAIAGSGSITGKNDFKNVKDLEVSIAGSGDVELSGSGDDLEISIAGSGNVELADFETNDCDVSIAGSGDCEIHVNGSLYVSIAGSGDVKYRGNPAKVKSKVAGSGDVRSF